MLGVWGASTGHPGASPCALRAAGAQAPPGCVSSGSGSGSGGERRSQQSAGILPAPGQVRALAPGPRVGASWQKDVEKGKKKIRAEGCEIEE